MVPKGRPVQILGHKENGFEFNDAAFQDMMQQKDLLDRKLVVISIVGEYRTGKSFFLNHVIRYLLNQGKSDWMKVEASKADGFEWRRDMERVTDGIMMWSRAFSLGDEYAVVLLDTEGTNDEISSVQTTSQVFAYSSLMSSVQIFNVSQRITKQTMYDIQAFAEYGRLAKCPEAKHAFQDLLFLVRDWNHPKRHKFGIDGGNDLFENWLKNDKDGVGDTIKDSFTSYSCYLMPRPGEIVQDNDDFCGDIIDMNAEFLVYLQQSIEYIFCLERIKSKAIGGKDLKLGDFPTYFKMFSETLSQTGIKPSTLFETQVKNCNAMATTNALVRYKEIMKEATDGNVNVDFSTAQEKASQEALRVYADTPKVGGADHKIALEYRRILAEDIEKECVNFKKYLNERRQVIREQEERKREQERAEAEKEKLMKHAKEQQERAEKSERERKENEEKLRKEKELRNTEKEEHEKKLQEEKEKQEKLLQEEKNKREEAEKSGYQFNPAALLFGLLGPVGAIPMALTLFSKK